VPEIGEEIVGAYLKECLHCDFVEYNYDLGSKQAECDVVGAALADKTVYFCEVATHTRGFLYVDPRTRKPANYERLTKKFANAIKFARQQFPDFRHEFMFWSPIVRTSRAGAKNNTMTDLNRLVADFKQTENAEIKLTINGEYAAKLNELRKVALAKTGDSPFSILRFLQIEENLKRFLTK